MSQKVVSMNTGAVNTVWEVNGNKFSFDMGDAEDAKHFQDVMKRFEAAEKALPKDGDMVQHIISYDKMFRDMYDDLFGEGAGDKILGSRRNMTNVDNTYTSFLEFLASQGNGLNDRRTAIINKYNGNRAQRRAAKH